MNELLLAAASGNVVAAVTAVAIIGIIGAVVAFLIWAIVKEVK